MPEYPINASAKFDIQSSFLRESIYFFYFDPEEIYYTIKQESLHGKTDELYKIEKNMQIFLDEDKVFLNGDQIFLNILNLQIDFLHDNKHPVLNFLIESTAFQLQFGINKFELDGDQQIASYPIIAEWKLPGKVMFVSSRTKHQINFNKIIFSTLSGETIGGYEIITFHWKSPFKD